MAKQSIVALPSEFKEMSQVRIVLLRLVEEVDKLLGYRGNNAATTAEEATLITESIILINQSLATLNTTNWDTAYSWGNHADEDYLKDNNVLSDIINEAIVEALFFAASSNDAKIAARVSVGI